MASNLQIKAPLIFACALLFGSTANIAMEIYIPSLPAIARSLHASINITQFSVAAFFGGLAIARLVFGILSDAFGRRIPIIVGAILALIGSVICLYAPNIYVLILGRMIQGLGSGGINIIGRIILRDIATGSRFAEYMSYFSMAGISLAIIAPLIGGYLQQFFGWRSVFLVLLIYMSVALFAALFIYRETNIHRSREHIRWPGISHNIKTLFSSRSFLICIALIPVAFGCMLVWETAGPVLLQNVVGLSPVQFGWISALVAVCYLAAATINGRVVKKFGINTMMSIGSFGIFLGGIAMLIPVLFNHISALAIVIPTMIMIFSLGFLIGNSFAKGIQPFAHIAGIATAILGSIQVAGGFLSSTIISFLPDHNQLPFALMLLMLGVISMMLAMLLRKIQE